LDCVFDVVLNTVYKYNMISNGDKVVVGLSGGADSIFLMEMLRLLQKEIDFSLCAAHLNHGIRGIEALHDAEFAQKYCRNNNIDFYIKEVSIPQIAKKIKISEETAGRQERYKFFTEICANGYASKIAVAHNMNDSVETIIHNMIRGSSLKGLTGIKPVNSNIIRPIIGVKRSEIEKYLHDHGLTFCTDSTNLSDVYTRNKIRNIILKTMSEINESVTETVYNNSRLLRDDDDFLNDYVDNINCVRSIGEKIYIDKKLFDKEKTAIKRRIILKAFEMLKGDCKNISSKHIDILCDINETGSKYDMPEGIYVYIYGENIVFSKNVITKKDLCLELSIPGKIRCYDNVFLTAEYCNEFDPKDSKALYIDADKLSGNILTVRNRNEGDRMVPFGKSSPKKIKKLFTDMKISTFEQDTIPLVCDGDNIAGIVPYRVSDIYKITENTKNIIRIYITKEE